MGRPKENRPIRIGGKSHPLSILPNPAIRTNNSTGASGSATDRRTAIADFARNYPNDPIDVIITDHLSEANMTVAAGRKADNLAAEAQTGNLGGLFAPSGPAYEASFLMSLEPALENLARYGVRVAANAGGADVTGCVRAIEEMIKKKGLGLKVSSSRWR
jgi:hypothetical protein